MSINQAEQLCMVFHKNYQEKQSIFVSQSCEREFKQVQQISCESLSPFVL